MKRMNLLLLCYTTVMSVLCACSASCSSTKQSNWLHTDYYKLYGFPELHDDNPLWPELDYQNFDIRNAGYNIPDWLDYSDEYIEKWWQKRQYEKKQAKWRRHKKKFYKNGLKFLNTFYDDLHFDFAFGFAIILFVYFAISRIPGVSLFLEDIGKKSGLIFMFHSFIYSLYFATFIYSFKYPPLIYLVLLGICYGVSWILQLLIDVTRVNKLNKLTL